MYKQQMLKLANPRVFISVNNNRIKSYVEEGEICVFLKDGTEFQLEFMNDSDCYIKADISINGKYQFSSLVLRPHQHFYLDRFMDEKKKFKFNTFLTGNDDIEKLKKIIEQNGKIEVRFYKELEQNYTYTTCNPSWITTWWEHQVDTYYSNGSDDSGKLDINYYSANASLQSNDKIKSSIKTKALNPDKTEIETGRVESGDKSKQDFTSVSKQWDIFPVATFQYHIMPFRLNLKRLK